MNSYHDKAESWFCVCIVGFVSFATGVIATILLGFQPQLLALIVLGVSAMAVGLGVSRYYADVANELDDPISYWAGKSELNQRTSHRADIMRGR